MMRLAGGALVVGLGAELFGLLSQDGSSAIAQVIGFTFLTLSLILLVLGSRSMRNLVG